MTNKKTLLLHHTEQKMLNPNLSIFSPDRLRVRGAGCSRAGGHRDGEAGRVPHLRGLLGQGARHQAHAQRGGSIDPRLKRTS